MSSYTGKSDFCDWCEMHNSPSEIVKCASIYMGGAKVEIKSEKDLIPYYTHLTSSLSCCDGAQTIYLSPDSFIDEEERSFMCWKITAAIKAARKAKKEKKPFTFEYLKSQKDFTLGGESMALWNKIIAIINKFPNIIKIHIPEDWSDSQSLFSSWIIPKYFYDVHDAMHNRMREEFIRFANNNGYAIIKDGIFLERTEGIYHPIINKMCIDIIQFHKMERDFKG